MSKMETDLIKLCDEYETLKRHRDYGRFENILGGGFGDRKPDPDSIGVALTRLINNHEELLQAAMNMDERLQRIDPTWK